MPNENLIQFVIPSEYQDTYNKLLNLMVYYGLDLMKDCKAGCDNKNIKLIECWNVFQSACAAYNVEYPSAATVLYNFVVAQLELLYKDELPSETLEFRIATDEEIDNITND